MDPAKSFKFEQDPFYIVTGCKMSIGSQFKFVMLYVTDQDPLTPELE